jgi:hypothetical protein
MFFDDAYMLKVRQVQKKKTKNKPTAQRRRLRKNLLSGKFPTQRAAAVAAGYSDRGNNAVTVASHEMRILREEFPEILAKHGLTDDALIETYLKPLMNATETKYGIFQGEFIEEREQIAWAPRKDGLEMALRLRGAFANEKKAETAGPTNITIEIVNIAGDEPVRVKAVDVTPQKVLDSGDADSREVAGSPPTSAT